LFFQPKKEIDVEKIPSRGIVEALDGINYAYTGKAGKSIF